MISSAAAVNGFKVLRSQPKSNTYSRKLTDEMVEIDDAASLSKNRQRRMSDLAKEVDIETLIAISVCFPVDSLTEEEIKANVSPPFGLGFNVVDGGSSISPELHPPVMEQVRDEGNARRGGGARGETRGCGGG
ncbi:hypothetical protein F0562_005202 [Nyssa sinensis]|uniref:Uncharacterized protein n=1 Tax=Nyssa sinensis TaxID=561372 RepID=A0A5J5AHI9_9ASTE|nr:hypothetical protein F0562_005202 [Nyssa sinensis]